MASGSVASSLGAGRASDRLQAMIAELDEIIGQIRITIFQLQRVPEFGVSGVLARLLDVITDVVQTLGSEPAVRFTVCWTW
ncbi:MAG: hypothetical protein ACRDTH_03115 [Pseudonocardiaceae bacterium]